MEDWFKEFIKGYFQGVGIGLIVIVFLVILLIIF